jgi:hypothetical protein
VVSKQIVTLDPIKQDFVCREAFRRALLEFVEAVQESVPIASVVAPETIAITDSKDKASVMPETLDAAAIEALGVADDIRPEDSASQVASQFVVPNEPVPEPSMSTVKSAVRSTMKSVAPPVLPAPNAPLVRAESVVSSTSGMTMKYPKIRKVVLDDDTSTVFNRTIVTKH